MAAKPNVLIAVMCGFERGGWLNPTLVTSLVAMSRDSRFDVEIELALGLSPVDYARNTCVVAARAKQVDWLLMVDNDQVLPQGNPLDILAEAGPQVDVIGLSTGISKDAGRSFHLNADFIPGISEGSFMGVSKVGSGVLILRNTVWTRLTKGPWFRTLQNDDELLSPKLSEDLFFCDLARASGLKLWTHRKGCGHLKTADITQFAVPHR
jgi:hypothetical protein